MNYNKIEVGIIFEKECENESIIKKELNKREESIMTQKKNYSLSDD